MKTTLLALILALTLTLAPETASAASSMFTYRPHAYTDIDGWPKWIGRLKHLALYERYKRPELATRYLPLSLVRTGRFAEIVDEVEDTPNVDTTDWPAWLGQDQ